MTVDILPATLLEPKRVDDMSYKNVVDVKDPQTSVKDLEDGGPEHTEPLEESQIQKMFAGSVVLLTGGTGFLGKLIVEKLLRSTELQRIYLLARPKKSKDIARRLQEQFDDVLYDRLRAERPDFLQKVTFVAGDVGQPGLGLTAADRDTLVQEVEVVLHGAATVRFDEPLPAAVRVNVRGTRELLRLARACPRLRALVHVSTAYSNCPLQEIEERFYPSRLPGDKLIELVDSVDEQLIDSITPGLLGEYPNTYAFTKAAAEDVVLRHSRGLPVALFRPSIVIGTAREPVAGWIDNVYGPTGVVVGAAVGLLHTLHCEPRALADLVPGDLVVGALLAAAWRTQRQQRDNSELAPPPDLPPPVYNYVSSPRNPLTWEKFMKYNEVHGLEVPTMQAVYCYLLCLTPSRWLYSLYFLLLHWLPAYVVDGIAVLIGKKPMLRKAYTKIAKFSEVMAYFATRQWRFRDDNTRRLLAELNQADRRLFPFDIAQLDWNDYFYRYIRGIRLYLLKDPLATIPRARTRYARLRALHYCVCGALALLLARLLWALF